MFRLPLYVVLFFALLSSISVSHAKDSDVVVTANVAYKAIMHYQSEPASPEALTLISIIVQFAEQSDDVLVTIDLKYFPSEFKTVEFDTRSHLLGSFIAGNVKYQIEHGIKANRPIEGVMSMLSVYASLRHAEKVQRLPSLDDWLVKAEKGDLTF